MASDLTARLADYARTHHDGEPSTIALLAEYDAQGAGGGAVRVDYDKFVPGMWCCAKCKFTLLQSNLNADTGTITARDDAGDKCPNCNSPLWRTTWKDHADEMFHRAEEQMLRANELQARLDAAPSLASDFTMEDVREGAAQRIAASHLAIGNELLKRGIGLSKAVKDEATAAVEEWNASAGNG